MTRATASSGRVPVTYGSRDTRLFGANCTRGVMVKRAGAVHGGGWGRGRAGYLLDDGQNGGGHSGGGEHMDVHIFKRQ